jgi:hypothetical protein
MRRLVLAIVAACFLCSCGGNNTYSPIVQGGPCSLPPIASKLLGKTWIGELDCGSTTRLLRLVFSQSGCDLVVTGQCLIYHGTSFPSFPGSGTGTIDPQTGNITPVGAPVTINGDKATFAPAILVVNPSGNRTIAPPLGILIVPGTTFPVSCTVTITDSSLTGTYSTQQAAPANQQGSVCFAPETVQTADVSGHWSGTMSATTNQSVGAGTLDFTLAMNGNLVNLASQGALTTSEVTVQLTPTIGVSGVVIGKRVLFGMTFIRKTNGQTDNIQHRWCSGTISGDTITGEFSDAIVPQGQGTFTITRSQATARLSRK